MLVTLTAKNLVTVKITMRLTPRLNCSKHILFSFTQTQASLKQTHLPLHHCRASLLIFISTTFCLKSTAAIIFFSFHYRKQQSNDARHPLCKESFLSFTDLA